MAGRTRRQHGNGLDAWPGYVDALSTLLMVIIFVLLVFVLAQAFLSATLAGRNEALDKARAELANLRSALTLERGRSEALERSATQASRDLAATAEARASLAQQLATLRDVTAGLARDRDRLTAELADSRLTLEAAGVAAERLKAALGQAETEAAAALRRQEAVMNERLAAAGKETEAARAALADTQRQLAAAQAQLAEMQRQIAALDRSVQVGKDTIEARLSELAQLAQQARALAALRDELLQRLRETEARLTGETAQRQAADASLATEKKLGEAARAEVALLRRDIEALRAQLATIAQALDVSRQAVRDKDTTIADLGQRLNIALADKVNELQRYRSEFFGRLRTLLENRTGIQVVGDRFVFQSEVLFPAGSAELSGAGIGQMTTLAITIKQIAQEIPPDVNWLLRVDGHTDPVPVRGGQFVSNWELSAARAITVVKLLIAAGVPPERLAATGFGEYQPLVPGDSVEAYAKDRRIELRLTDR